MTPGFVSIRLVRDPGPSTPYEPPIEDALQSLSLPELQSDATDVQGFVRHETGPEIFALATALVSLVHRGGNSFLV